MVSDYSDQQSDKWLDLLVVFIVFTSIAAVVLLMCDAFAPKVAVLIGATGSAAVWCRDWKSVAALSHTSPVGWGGLAAVLLFALLFRFEFFPWIHGGQDQGVYYSMSAHYQNGGTVFFDDPVLSAVSGDDQLMTVYTENNQHHGGFQPGIYLTKNGKHVFQFYHLHPLWMAIFADMFGDGARGASVVVFSLLSILFLSLLTFELSGSRYAAFAVGVMLSLNPLHAFFSKWPVTEVVALAFSAMGLYYLARAYAVREQAASAMRSGCLAALCFSLIFFVRISGFVYLPFLMGVFLVGVWLWRVQRQHIGRVLMVFVLISIVGYLLSVGYGLTYSPNYSLDIYRMNFGKLFGERWPLFFCLSLATMLAVMAVLYVYLPQWVRTNNSMPARYAAVLTTCLMVVAVLAAVLSLYKVYRLGYTDHYQKEAWMGVRWRLSGSGFAALERSSVLNWALYSSPVLLLVGGWAVWRQRSNVAQLLLLLVTLVPLAVFIISNPILPYQYYYARYLLSEAVPYAIVISIAALAVAIRFRRVWVTAVLALSALGSGAITLAQWGAEEGRKPLKSLSQLSAHIAKDDMLMISSTGWLTSPVRVVTPLRFYFGLQTFLMPPNAWSEFADRLNESYAQVWLLSPEPIDDNRFELVDRVTYEDKITERVGGLPLSLIDEGVGEKLFLYLLRASWKSEGSPTFKLRLNAYAITADSAVVASVLGQGWFAIEPARVWSTDRAEVVLRRGAFGPANLPDILQLNLAAYGASTGSPVELVLDNGRQIVSTVFQSSEHKMVTVPLQFEEGSERLVLRLTIKGASSPSSRGASADARLLGVSLFGLEFKKIHP